MRIARFAAAMAVFVSLAAPAMAQGGPAVIGQEMAYRDDAGKVTIVQAPSSSGGVIQLSAFGWLEPYIDSIIQALIAGGLAWLGKSKYGQWMDETSRDAIEVFTKNAASSLISDGFVQMQGKTVHVDSTALAAEASAASTRIPDALKRFGVTPELVAAKIVDAIPQTPAGAVIVAKAHLPPQDPASPDWPPTSASAS